MDQSGRAASFLASVTNEGEARLCAALGADVIDAKNPTEGALGALPGERVRAIRASVPANIPVSATIGDPMDDPETTVGAVRLTAATGADIVKIGLWPGAAEMGTVRALGRLALGHVRLVGVLLVDRGIDLKLIAPLRDAGFAGVMLDTSDKCTPLPELLPADALESFIDAAKGAGLFAGLAGSLRLSHVSSLLELGPDVLGFRGGLCREGARVAAIDADAVRAIRQAIPATQLRFGPCRTPLGDAKPRWQIEGAA